MVSRNSTHAGKLGAVVPDQWSARGKGLWWLTPPDAKRGQKVGEGGLTGPGLKCGLFLLVRLRDALDAHVRREGKGKGKGTMDATMDMDTDGMDDRVAAGRGADSEEEEKRERGWTTEKQMAAGLSTQLGQACSGPRAAFRFV